MTWAFPRDSDAACFRFTENTNEKRLESEIQIMKNLLHFANSNNRPARSYVVKSSQVRLKSSSVCARRTASASALTATRAVASGESPIIYAVVHSAHSSCSVQANVKAAVPTKFQKKQSQRNTAEQKSTST